MRKPILLSIVAIAFGLNFWLGNRVPVGAACPLMTSPSTASLVTPTGGECARPELLLP